MIHLILVQPWTESEKGWGSRPDGYSLHLSEEDRDKYLKNDTAARGSTVPNEYSFPDGEPYLTVATEGQLVHLKTAKSKAAGGVRYGSREPKPPRVTAGAY